MPTAECQTSVPTAFAEEPLQKSERTATFLAFGESMIRYMPLDEPDQHSQTSRHLPQPFLRSLGGDELNVTVALSLIGFPSKWISVVPTGPMGDILLDGCMHHGVEPAVVRVDGDVGTYTMIPERKTVVYQRRHSVFALQDPEALDWPSLLGGGAAAADRPWLHLTGITPLVSPNAAKSWERAVVTAAGSIIPISLDLNHRPQLGTFDQLWAIVKPHAPTFEVMILSLGQLNDIGQLTHPEWQPLTPAEADELLLERMLAVCLEHGFKRIALCRKVRDAAGVQKRWSLLVDRFGSIDPRRFSTEVRLSTAAHAVHHVPKDECGGGSAWAAGFIASMHARAKGAKPADTLMRALRVADLLSALCQESRGDFSTVSAEELAAAEVRYIDHGAEARLPGAGDGVSLGLGLPPLPSAAEAERMLSATLAGLKSCGVLAILRAKGDPQVAIARGIELAEMGCRAMEVTLDSTDWKVVLTGLRKALPPHVLLGVGTVMDDTVSQIGLIKSLGASFALSPIDPIGFIDECHRHGVLAVPSALTSNECWDLHRRGCRLIKLFHAGLLSPALLKSILDVTPLGRNLNILPSGGVTPVNAADWWDAGAAVIGMGSNLVGKDIGLPYESPGYEKAVSSWNNTGKDVAASLFDECEKRFPYPSGPGAN